MMQFMLPRVEGGKDLEDVFEMLGTSGAHAVIVDHGDRERLYMNVDIVDALREGVVLADGLRLRRGHDVFRALPGEFQHYAAADPASTPFHAHLFGEPPFRFAIADEQGAYGLRLVYSAHERDGIAITTATKVCYCSGAGRHKNFGEKQGSGCVNCTVGTYRCA